MVRPRLLRMVKSGLCQQGPSARLQVTPEQARRALSEQDLGASFGAFADGILVADLGIVVRHHGAIPERWHQRAAP